MNESSAVAASYQHFSSVVNTQPTVHPGLTAAFQYPAARAKPLLSVFGNGDSETKTEWKVPPRKNEDRYILAFAGTNEPFIVVVTITTPEARTE